MTDQNKSRTVSLLNHSDVKLAINLWYQKPIKIEVDDEVINSYLKRVYQIKSQIAKEFVEGENNSMARNESLIEQFSAYNAVIIKTLKLITL